MSENAEGINTELPQEAHTYIMQDLLKRVSRIEDNNLHPRLQNVEVGLEEIRQEFRIIRDEQRAAGLRSDDNFKELTEKLEQSIHAIEEHQHRQIDGILDRIGKMTRRLAYWAGGGTAFLGILTFIVIYIDEIALFLEAVRT